MQGLPAGHGHPQTWQAVDHILGGLYSYRTDSRPDGTVAVYPGRHAQPGDAARLAATVTAAGIFEVVEAPGAAIAVRVRAGVIWREMPPSGAEIATRRA